MEEVQRIIKKYPAKAPGFRWKQGFLFFGFAAVFLLGAVLCSTLSGNNKTALTIYVIAAIGIVILGSIFQARRRKRAVRRYALQLSELTKRYRPNRSPRQLYKALMEMEIKPPSEDMRALWRITVSEALCGMDRYDTAIAIMEDLAKELSSAASQASNLRLQREVKAYCERMAAEQERKQAEEPKKKRH